jgi:hypothetical protein
MAREISSKQERKSEELKDEIKHDLHYPKREDEVIAQNLKTHRLQKGEIQGHGKRK